MSRPRTHQGLIRSYTQRGFTPQRAHELIAGAFGRSGVALVRRHEAQVAARRARVAADRALDGVLLDRWADDGGSPWLRE